MEQLETSKGKRDVNPFLKLALEVGPLAVFFIMNGRFGIFCRDRHRSWPPL